MQKLTLRECRRCGDCPAVQVGVLTGSSAGVVCSRGEGTITYTEFFEFIDEPRSLFTDLIYDKIVERAGARELEFDDFICAVTIYSLYSKPDLLRSECWKRECATAIVY